MKSDCVLWAHYIISNHAPAPKSDHIVLVVRDSDGRSQRAGTVEAAVLSAVCCQGLVLNST